MAPRCFFIFFIVLGVCRSLPEGSEYPSTSEFSKKQLTEDRLLANIVRARNSSKSSQAKDNENDSEDRNADKRARTVIRGPPSSESRDIFDSPRSNCCGTRQGSGSLSRPDYDKIPTEGGRYPPSYGDRNVDRHGWQVPIRPTGSNIGGGRPTSGSYGGSYGGSGVYGGTYAGDRFGSRPGYGGESSNRPGGPSYGSGGTGGYGYGNGGYGGYGGTRPGIGYGITGTLEDGDDFNPNEPDIPENGVHPHYPGNIQTQKAVALKALAGVALIGAAAALATNPVLLPIGIVSGRRKRSEITSENNEIMDYVLQMITENLSRTNNDRSYDDKKIVPPKCVARLTCEIRKDYMADLTENTGERYDDKYAKIQFNNLIQSNVLNTASIDDSIKELIKMALAVSSDKGDCGVFACNFTHDN